MLIVNDEQRLRAGIGSLSKRCQYCSKALAAYPLILSDDARLAVYHAACAAELATEIMVDLYTFLSPPAPYSRLFVLTAPEAAPTPDPSPERGRQACASRTSSDTRSDTGSERISARSRRLCGSKPSAVGHR